MGQDREINQAYVIQNALSGYEGLTSSEKTYCSENVVEWISKDKTLNLLIEKFSEISLNIRPFLKKNGLLV